MPFYEIIEEPATCWYDDDEPMERGECCADGDDMADMYLRAEEAWPRGATVLDRNHALASAPSGYREDDFHDFDD